jgi:peroxiredoxin (alkyl hydroperoxide reductase subunit C)
MKNRLALCVMLLLLAGNLWSQDKGNTHIPMIGDDAPSFTAETTSGVLNFPSDYGRSWKIIFSHPRDFTPVCSSELLTLSHMQDGFEKLNAKVVVISTDDLQKHFMWKKALEETAYKNMEPTNIKFPIIDDSKMNISRSYGMLHISASTTKDVRGVFIISPDNKVEAIYFYPMNIGRNMDEIKRTLVALQTVGTGKDRVLTPANWQVGDDVLVPQFPYTEKQLKENPDLKLSYYNVGSYMWFKKM